MALLLIPNLTSENVFNDWRQNIDGEFWFFFQSPSAHVVFCSLKRLLNKNDSIHKNEVQNFKKLDDHTNIDKYRVTANITEYHNISKGNYFM